MLNYLYMQHEGICSGTKKTIIIITVVFTAALIYNFTPVRKMLDLSEIYMQKEYLLEAVRSRYLFYSVIYFFTYILLAGITLPGSALMSILGGFFFGPIPGLLMISLSATSGAFMVFWIVRKFAGHNIQQRYNEKLKIFNEEIKANGTNYLIMLRIMPVFPFFLVNILAGFTKIPAVTFIWTTLAGMLPGSIIYVYIGYTGSSMDRKGFLSPGIYAALSLLAFLSILPVIIKKINRRKLKG